MVLLNTIFKQTIIEFKDSVVISHQKEIIFFFYIYFAKGILSNKLAFIQRWTATLAA